MKNFYQNIIINFFFFLVKWNVRDKTPEKEGSLTTFLSQF